MPRNYTRSAEGEAAYKKIGLEYENATVDDWYDHFLKICRLTPEKDVKREIMNIKRLVLPKEYIGGNVGKNDPKEYLVWNMVERRKDALGNEKHHSHSDLGIYPIPVPNWVFKAGDEETGYEKQRVVEGIARFDTGYSLPYSPANVDKLAKQTVWNTTYSIERLSGGHRIQIPTLKDFRNGDAEELLRWAHIANPTEKQIMLDELSGKIQQMSAAAGRVYR